MSENLDTPPEAGDKTAPVTEAVSSEATPKVEIKDGKTYVNGVRVYTRDDTNKIAANARKEAETKFLKELEVESLDSVKQVVKSLQTGAEPTLDVQSLRDAVKKKEQTVEELKAELQQVRTQSVLKEHIGQLQNAMPQAWNAEQRSAVLDLMKARNMLHLEGETFAIRNGDQFITDSSGEAPDYTAAVQLIGKTLGLPMSKQGVATFETPDAAVGDPQVRKALDEARMKTDALYRSAYIKVREANKSLAHKDVTDAMVRKQIDSMQPLDLRGRQLHTANNPTKKGK